MSEFSVATGSRTSPSDVSPALLVAVCLSFEAALIHAWYVPQSFMEWWGYGVFFAACAAGQAIYGPLLLRTRSRLVLLGGIWSNAVVLALYVVTRWWGVPLGPHQRAVEQVGLFDLTATLSETLLVLVLVGRLEGRARRVTVDALMLLGVALWVLRLTI